MSRPQKGNSTILRDACTEFGRGKYNANNITTKNITDKNIIDQKYNRPKI